MGNVFGPILMRDEKQEEDIQSQIVQLLLEDYDTIFPHYGEC